MVSLASSLSITMAKPMNSAKLGIQIQINFGVLWLSTQMVIWPHGKIVIWRVVTDKYKGKWNDHRNSHKAAYLCQLSWNRWRTRSCQDQKFSIFHYLCTMLNKPKTENCDELLGPSQMKVRSQVKVRKVRVRSESG